jgi:hypothetical protein
MDVSLMERGFMIYRCNGRESIGVVSVRTWEYGSTRSSALRSSSLDVAVLSRRIGRQRTVRTNIALKAVPRPRRLDELGMWSPSRPP